MLSQSINNLTGLDLGAGADIVIGAQSNPARTPVFVVCHGLVFHMELFLGFPVFDPLLDIGVIGTVGFCLLAFSNGLGLGKPFVALGALAESDGSALDDSGYNLATLKPVSFRAAEVCVVTHSSTRGDVAGYRVNCLSALNAVGVHAMSAVGANVGFGPGRDDHM
jgi:hypothetical protein